MQECLSLDNLSEIDGLWAVDRFDTRLVNAS